MVRLPGPSRLCGLLALLLSAPICIAADPALRPPQDQVNRLPRTVPTRADPGATRTAPPAGPNAHSSAYHYGAALICDDCHILHGGGTNPGLLKRSTSLELCLTCHDGQAGIPDVVGADCNGLADRAAGAFAPPGVVNPNGHNLGPAESDPCQRCHSAGDLQTVTVTCIDCHDPHGNGRPRNLRWASAPAGTSNLGLFTDPRAVGLSRYETAHVAYGTDGTANLREVTSICLRCHHVLSGTNADGDGRYTKHPVTDSERGTFVPVSQGRRDGGSDPAHWMSGTGAGFDVPRLRFLTMPATAYGEANIVSAENNVFCLTCHRAHGSDQPLGLAWRNNPGGSVGPSGCDQCHGKSG